MLAGGDVFHLDRRFNDLPEIPKIACSFHR
jgi:hypothetical protein